MKTISYEVVASKREIKNIGSKPVFRVPVLWIRIRIHMFFGLPDKDQDPPAEVWIPDLDPSINMQK
jgi:hypothetical protein